MSNIVLRFALYGLLIWNMRLPKSSSQALLPALTCEADSLHHAFGLGHQPQVLVQHKDQLRAAEDAQLRLEPRYDPCELCLQVQVEARRELLQQQDLPVVSCSDRYFSHVPELTSQSKPATSMMESGSAYLGGACRESRLRALLVLSAEYPIRNQAERAAQEMRDFGVVRVHGGESQFVGQKGDQVLFAPARFAEEKH